jgi:uncharacterized protein
MVRISGLSEGKHDFSFNLGQEFFALFEQTEIEQGEVYAGVVLEKSAGAMALHFHLSGKVQVLCDRCLDPFMIAISSDQQLIVKRGDVPGDIGDDVIVIGQEDHEIDIRQYLYEFIVLALPIKRIHPADENGLSTCNPGMIKKLEAHRGGAGPRRKRTDPRWDALKEIIENNN